MHKTGVALALLLLSSAQASSFRDEQGYLALDTCADAKAWLANGDPATTADGFLVLAAAHDCASAGESSVARTLLAVADALPSMARPDHRIKRARVLIVLTDWTAASKLILESTAQRLALPPDAIPEDPDVTLTSLQLQNEILAKHFRSVDPVAAVAHYRAAGQMYALGTTEDEYAFAAYNLQDALETAVAANLTDEGHRLANALLDFHEKHDVERAGTGRASRIVVGAVNMLNRAKRTDDASRLIERLRATSWPTVPDALDDLQP